jgi:hypothetical protein
MPDALAPRMEQAASQIQDSSDLLDFSSMGSADWTLSGFE